MIIKTFKQPIKGVISISYTFGEDKFKLGSENSSYEFDIDSLETFIKALKEVKKHSKKVKRNG